MRNKFLGCLLLFVVSFSAEAKDLWSPVSAFTVRAPMSISESFLVQTIDPMAKKSKLRVDKARVLIKKASLEKEFLLQSSGISQLEAPMFTGLKSRIVVFKIKNGELFMLEATQGYTVTNDLPQNLVLAKFPILFEDDESIAFDFVAGMTRLFVASDWRASDFDGNMNFQVAYAPVSYLESAEMTGNNTLTIRQIATVLTADNSEYVPIEVKYYLTPYHPSEDFVPTRSDGYERMGFFEVAPQITKDGSKVSFATKFHVQKPIVFAISSTTPLEYREAIRDGVLYWNKAFGEEKLQVVDAPDKLTAPDPNYNIIQWVNWESAGFAYADAQMDPRVGEALHAQVYMTSVFAITGRAKARRLLRKLEEKSESKGPFISLAGFSEKPTCNLNFFRNSEYRNMLKATLTKVLASSASDADILRISQDYVREVAAHEIGHTLGLRHNFAGSLATTIPLEERESIVYDYVTKGLVPASQITSSSVMEYQVFEEGSMTGHQMARREKILPYDEKAIRYLYLDEKVLDTDIPLFCTDSQVGTFQDCQRFDIGNSPIEFAYWAMKDNLKNYPNVLAEKFITLKTPISGMATDIEKIDLNPENEASSLMEPRILMTQLLTSNAKLLSVYRRFSKVTSLNEKRVQDLQHLVLQKEVERLGGLDRLFFSVGKEELEKLFYRFIGLVSSDSYRSGIGNNGQSYEFSDIELSFMKSIVRQLVDQLTDPVAMEEIEILSSPNKNNPIIDHALGDQLARVLEKKISEYVFSTEEGKDQFYDVTLEKTENGKIKKERVMLALPVFTYSKEVRTEASQLLDESQAKDPMWGMQERGRLKQLHEAFMKKIFQGHSISEFSLEKVPVEVGRWIKENKSISFSP